MRKPLGVIHASELQTMPPVRTFPVLTNPSDDLARIRREIPALWLELKRQRLKPQASNCPLMFFGRPHKVVQMSRDEMGSPEQWFFIGDIHGDFFALHSLLRYAEKQRPDDCKVLFLGDIVDRGDLPFECLFLLLEWGMRRPDRLVWIAGNHDVAFDYSDQTHLFSSLVSPAELLNVLNPSHALSGFGKLLGDLLIHIGEQIPRAILFPDGLLATHGGFPLVDRQAEAAFIDQQDQYTTWLNSESCLKDFTWTRIHRAPKKIPDRFSTGSEYGFQDFESFCALKPDWFSVKRMITGHQHPLEGFTQHASYKVNPALTLIGFGFDDEKPHPASYHDYPEKLHIAQGVEGQLPTVLEVTVNRGELEMMYPQLQTKLAPSAAEFAVVNEAFTSPSKEV